LAKNKLIESYNSFWENIRFKKGWEKPTFYPEDVKEQLENAAEIVVRIRSALDKKRAPPTVRVIDGSAKEFLWSISNHPDATDYDSFIKGLVHANFMDTAGYVENLSEDYVDDQINVMLNFWANENWSVDLVKAINDNIGLFERLWNEFRSENDVENLTLDHQSDLKNISDHLALLISDFPSLQNDQESQNEMVKHHQEETKEHQEEMKEYYEETKEYHEETKEYHEEKKENNEESKEHHEETKEHHEAKEDIFEENIHGENIHEENILHINRLELEVSGLSKEFLGFQDEINNLDSQQDNYGISKAKVQDLKKKCLQFADYLMKEMDELDSIVGDSKIVPLRKKQVITIQAMLNDVEKIQTKLNSLSSTLDKHPEINETTSDSELEELVRMEKLAQFEKMNLAKDDDFNENEEAAKKTKI